MRFVLCYGGLGAEWWRGGERRRTCKSPSTPLTKAALLYGALSEKYSRLLTTQRHFGRRYVCVVIRRRLASVALEVSSVVQPRQTGVSVCESDAQRRRELRHSPRQTPARSRRAGWAERRPTGHKLHLPRPRRTTVLGSGSGAQTVEGLGARNRSEMAYLRKASKSSLQAAEAIENE